MEKVIQKHGQHLFSMLVWKGLIIGTFQAGTMQDTNAIRNHILTNYSTDTLPITDQDGILYINASFYLRSIVDIDEPKGEVTTTLGILLSWTDEGLKWDGSKFGHRYLVRIKRSEIWSPSLLLGNCGSEPAVSNSIEEQRAIVVYNGTVFDFKGMIVNTICDIEVTYYPFDIQKCHIIFNTWDFGVQMRFHVVNPTIDLSTFIENGIWVLSKTEISTYADPSGQSQFLRGTLYLERRSLFYILNFLAPILVLMLLNSMVFVLPTDSGERVGFSVTILLSIAVYMTIISDKLPETSKPTSVLCFILIIYLLQSASICVETVFSLRFFHRDDSKSVGAGWIGCVSCMQHKVCKDEKKTDHSDRVEIKCNQDNNKCNADYTSTCVVNQKSPSLNVEKDSWTNVSKSIDSFFLIINILLTVVLAFVYTVVVLTRPQK